MEVTWLNQDRMCWGRAGPPPGAPSTPTWCPHTPPAQHWNPNQPGLFPRESDYSGSKVGGDTGRETQTGAHASPPNPIQPGVCFSAH